MVLMIFANIYVTIKGTVTTDGAKTMNQRQASKHKHKNNQHLKFKILNSGKDKINKIGKSFLFHVLKTQDQYFGKEM